MTFMEKLTEICKERGTTPFKLSQELGMSPSNTKFWRDECEKDPMFEPSRTSLNRLCEALNIDRGRLSPTPNTTPTPAASDELMEYLDMLRARPECRALLKTAKNATKEAVEENVRFIEALRAAKK